MKLEFCRQIFGGGGVKISSFIKNCPVGAELFHVDRQTDGHDEANSCFS